MKRFILSFVVLFAFVSLASAQSNKKKRYDGEGVGDVEVRDVPDFDDISVGGGIDLYIHQANDRKVQVESDNIDLDNIKTEVKDGTLHIGMKSNGWSWGRNTKVLRVDVWIDDLDGIRAGGGSDVYTEGTFKSDELWVKSGGGSDMRLNLSVGKLDGHSSGGSDLWLSGDVDELVLHSSGGSDVNAYKLNAKRVTVSSSGGSDAYVNATDEISITASGASDVHVKGNAKILKKKSSGSSDIHIN